MVVTLTIGGIIRNNMKAADDREDSRVILRDFGSASVKEVLVLDGQTHLLLATYDDSNAAIEKFIAANKKYIQTLQDAYALGEFSQQTFSKYLEKGYEYMQKHIAAFSDPSEEGLISQTELECISDMLRSAEMNEEYKTIARSLEGVEVEIKLLDKTIPLEDVQLHNQKQQDDVRELADEYDPSDDLELFGDESQEAEPVDNGESRDQNKLDKVDQSEPLRNEDQERLEELKQLLPVIIDEQQLSEGKINNGKATKTFYPYEGTKYAWHSGSLGLRHNYRYI